MSDFKIDFCGVGAAKAGTTWISRQLMEHPQACIGRRKELNYFIKTHPFEGVIPRAGTHFDTVHYSQGLDWYEKQFDRCQPGQLKGELSTTYLMNPETPELLKQHNPDIRLIMNIRNPVDAIYSLYYQINEYHTVRESFEDLLKRTKRGFMYYNYPKHVKRFLSVFPEDQMLFIFLDDIKEDSIGVYNKLCKHLNIDPIELEITTRKVNPSKRVKSTFIRDASLRLYSLFELNDTTRNFRQWLREKRVSRYAHKLRLWNTEEGKYPPMKPATRERLIEQFHDEIVELGNMFDRDLSHWLKMPEPKKAAKK